MIICGAKRALASLLRRQASLAGSEMTDSDPKQTYKGSF